MNAELKAYLEERGGKKQQVFFTALHKALLKKSIVGLYLSLQAQCL